MNLSSLCFSPGEVFGKLLDQYLRRSLHKGVPSLFMTIRGLYSDPAKVCEQQNQIDFSPYPWM